MTTEILPIGDTAASSADFTIGDSGMATLFLTTAAGGSAPFRSKVYVELKANSGQYMVQGELNSSSPSFNLQAAPGAVARVTRKPSVAVGVDLID